MSSLTRSIKRNINKHGGKGCPRCGEFLIDHECVMCGWMKKSANKHDLDAKAKLMQND